MREKPPSPAPLDWTAVRRRLARAEAAQRETLEPTPSQTRSLLDERANRLAAPTAEVHPAVLETLTFAVGRERYAVDSKFVHGVAPLVEFTPVPGAPEFIVGVINLRGQVLAIADLRRVFRFQPGGVTDLARVIVLGDARPDLGILADEAHELRALPLTEILEPPESVVSIDREYLLGVTSEALIVLDAARLLADPRLSIG